MALDFPDSPSDGQIYGIFTWDATASAWRVQNATSPIINVHALVVAGGGSPSTNGSYNPGAGGAGGYVEQSLALAPATAYTVTVGAGGAGVPTNYTIGNTGNNSVFATITANGGGYGGQGGNPGGVGGTGGSAGGSGFNQSGETASDGTGQGADGGRGLNSAEATGGGGGGVEGGNDSNNSWYRNGGRGAVTRIISTSVATSESVGEVATWSAIGVDQLWFAGGGAGSSNTTPGYAASAGLGGGGTGRYGGTLATSGTANTGGGGGAPALYQYNVAGGSGVVIIRLASNVSATISAGLTYTTDTSVSGSTAYIFKSGTGTVTFG